jgi:hypothetical protein
MVSLKFVLRLIMAAAVLRFVLPELVAGPLGTLQYFTYTGSLVIALVLIFIASGRLDDRHLVLGLSAAWVIHLVYIFLLVGLAGVPNDLLTGGLENLVLHYLTPYYLLFDALVLSEPKRHGGRDALYYLLLPVAYLPFVMLYGQSAGAYPYFFLDVNELGVWVAVYVAAILGMFAGLNWLFGVTIIRRVHERS